jgi:thioredoxin reductase (NADPH)
VTDDGNPPTETPDRDGAFPRLSELQVAALARHGERRPTQAGEVLFHQGDRHYDFFVVLDGLVRIVDGEPDDGELIAVHGPRRFLGELSLLIGQAAFFTAVVAEPGEVLAVPVERLREIVAEDAALGDLILRAYLLRRELLVGLGAGLRIIGSRFDPETRRLREFAARNRLPHRFVDVEQDDAAEALLSRLGVAPQETPVVVWGRKVLRNPANGELARAIGLSDDSPAGKLNDLVVVGAGPAGLAAAVYGASEGLETLTLEAVAPGGQAATSSRIENYLGFPSGISGADLAERAHLQAEKFGARLTVPGRALALEPHEGHNVIRLDDGSTVSARTVIIATGVRYRKLPVPRLEHFEGTSVYYAATQIEAMLCAGDPVVVVGGGNSAGQATLFLSRHVPVVRLLIRHGELARDMSRYLADRIERTPTVEVIPNTEVRELVGEQALEEIVAEDLRTGERARLPCRALFVFIGADPHTSWLGDQVALDERGFILTGDRAAEAAGEDCDPSLLETSRPGVYAAGDVRSGSIKRVASAVGEGAMAVRFVHEHIGSTPHVGPDSPGQRAATAGLA